MDSHDEFMIQDLMKEKANGAVEENEHLEQLPNMVVVR
jgi:hypothetical protein